MGEASRRRAAALRGEFWPGGEKRCPTCFGTRVVCEAAPALSAEVEFYSRRLAMCVCGEVWEPIDEASIWDRSDPHCSALEPCDNCAFRAGSPESRDAKKWGELLASLRAGGSFYCHKGVPIAPDSEHGFKYPSDRSRLRLCRGYLNALGKWWKVDAKAVSP